MNTLIGAVRSVMTGKKERWDEETDATMQYMRRQTDSALMAAERLRALGIPLTGNILEDNATGAASRYRRYRRIGSADPRRPGTMQ